MVLVQGGSEAEERGKGLEVTEEKGRCPLRKRTDRESRTSEAVQPQVVGQPL